MDIGRDMSYLHNSSLGCHGNLSSNNCVVDFRWICKVTDYALHKSICIGKGITTPAHDIPAYKFLWTAPELLQSGNPFGTRAGDVYSFGVIIQELSLQDEPFAAFISTLDPEEIIQRIKDGDVSMKPQIPDALKDVQLLVNELCSWSLSRRPSFRNILEKKEFGQPHSLVDNMIFRLEEHTQNLESIIEKRSLELEAEKRKAECLLLELLPAQVIEDFKFGKEHQPQIFEQVTIFYSDIVSFTQISAAGSAMDVVRLLNCIYTMFDAISTQFDVYKIATIGDAYFVASGVPIPNGIQHAHEVCSMALALLKASRNFVIPHLQSETLKLRVGIHSGPCVAGVVGIKTPQYLLFGETVDIASKMESSGAAMKIQISQTTAALLEGYEDFIIDKNEEDSPIKGQKQLKTFWLHEEEANNPI